MTLSKTKSSSSSQQTILTSFFGRGSLNHNPNATVTTTTTSSTRKQKQSTTGSSTTLTPTTKGRSNHDVMTPTTGSRSTIASNIISGRKRRRMDGSSSFGVCPMCQKSIALYKLEAHAADCNGLEEETTTNSKMMTLSSIGTPSLPSTGPVLMDNVTDNNVTSAAVTPSNCTALLLPQGDEQSQSQKQSLSLPLNVLPYSEPIPGLFLFENILTREEEVPILRLLDLEDVIPWKTSRFNGISYGKRWGVHCNLRDRRVDAPEHPLPKEIQHFIQTKLSLVKETLKGRCNNAQFLDFQPNEANAIDYRRKEGHWLQAHVDDRQLSKEPIANLSLAGDCIMTFRLQNRRLVSQQQQQQQQQQQKPYNNNNHPEEHRVLLKRGTLQVLTGKARYDYSHAIANTDLLSDRRVSITMRESPLTLAPSYYSRKPPRTSSVTVNNNIISSPKPLPHFAWRNYYQPPPKQQQQKQETTAARNEQPIRMIRQANFEMKAGHQMNAS